MLRRLCYLLAAASLSVSAEPDFIIHNAAITDFDGESYSAIAVTRDTISAIGDSEGLLALRDHDTQIIDARGRRLIPGLNDSHLHVVRGGRFYNLETRWDGIDSLEEGLALIREQAARTPEGQWVRVIGGWTPFQFRERRMPTVAELNEAAPDTPVFVLFLYSGGLLNEAGMQALGIDANSEAPAGSRFERDSDGRPTGVLVADPNPAVLYQTIARLPPMNAEQQLSSTRHFYRHLLSLGVTSAVDAGGGGHSFPEDYAATAELAARGELSLRVSAYLFPQEPGRELQQFTDWMNRFDADMHLTDDGSYVIEGGGELLVWSASDYENFTAERPELAARAEQELDAVVRLHVRNGWPFRIHATYDESISLMLDVLEAIDDDMPLASVRWAFDHAETISDANLARVKALGGGIAVQGRMAFAGEYFVERYGAEQARRSPPLRRMLDLEIPVALGTDGTRVASFNPWDAYYWAVTGRSLGGLLLYDEDNILDRLTALRLFTQGSAWLSGDEARKGALEVGMLADLAVLDRDILAIDAEELRATQATLTLVGGKVVYSSGELVPATGALPPALPAWSPVNFQ
ncbi:MAG: amidohydrolase [Xanthomonadales bacterium]|jgi:predicted amidohydrolase YtcJ|nr:amidohydrolase [Xanthomonadales bacterium]